MTLLVLILILVSPYLILTPAGKWNPKFQMAPAKRARVGLSLFFIFTAIGHFIRIEPMAVGYYISYFVFARAGGIAPNLLFDSFRFVADLKD